MKRTTTNSIVFEIHEQDLVGNGAAQQEIKKLDPEELTAQGRCGWLYTVSYECSDGIITCG